MILNLEQEQAVANGEAVELNVAGTDCILLRRDVYLRLDLEPDADPWTLEEMNLLSDEADEIISRKEADEA